MSINDREWILKSSADYIKLLNNLIRVHDSTFEAIRKMPLNPVSRKFGEEFGKPIDRFYIEKFLDTNRSLIFGDVMEIADSTYTNKYGHDVKCSYVLHVEGKGNSIKGNLSTGEGITENLVDCLICTQTIQFIYDLESVAKNIYRLLKPNGNALITCSSISQIALGGYRRWGDYWRFTPLSLKLLFSNVFGEEKVKVDYYGNVKTAIGFLYGLSCSDLKEDDFEYIDEQYPITISVICKKI